MSRGLITLQFIFCFFFVSETLHLSATNCMRRAALFAIRQALR